MFLNILVEFFAQFCTKITKNFLSAKIWPKFFFSNFCPKSTGMISATSYEYFNINFKPEFEKKFFGKIVKKGPKSAKNILVPRAFSLHTKKEPNFFFPICAQKLLELCQQHQTSNLASIGRQSSKKIFFFGKFSKCQPKRSKKWANFFFQISVQKPREWFQ